MPTNQQRREAERRRLQRQLEQRRSREAARKRMTLIGSIVGTVIVIAAVVVTVVLTTGGSGKKSTAAGEKDTVSGSPSASSSPSTSASTEPAPPAPTTPCAVAPKGASASFRGVTVSNAKDLKHAPKITSKGTTAPANIECQDLVVGTGKAATSASTVSVQYAGVLYKDGTAFDSSWKDTGKPASFSLSQVVKGFAEGIGGDGKVAPMKVGGRRLMILPASLAYGAQANGSIPANSTLVFVVDLTSVS